jgi:hypothetical protein
VNLGGVDPFDLPEEDHVNLLAYILHRRTEKGFLDSLSAASARDHVLLSNLGAKAAKGASKGSGDPEIDAMNAMLEAE